MRSRKDVRALIAAVAAVFAAIIGKWLGLDAEQIATIAGTIVILATALIWGIAKEDAATKGNPANGKEPNHAEETR